MEVVVVLPWLPAIAMPYFRRISSASSSPRGITGMFSRRASSTSGLRASTAELTTTALAPAMFAAAWPSMIAAPSACQPLGGGAEFQIGPADLVAEVQQHFRDPGHADAADAGEVQMLRLKKHFYLVLFRLSRRKST